MSNIFGGTEKWNLSLGVTVSLYRGYRTWDPLPCPLLISYADGNNSKFGDYPRIAVVQALGTHVYRFLNASSAELRFPWSEAKAEDCLRICGGGTKFPRHLGLLVQRHPWTLEFCEEADDVQPGFHEQWILWMDQSGVHKSFEDFMLGEYYPSQDINGNDHHHSHILGGAATTVPMSPEAFVIPWGGGLQGVKPKPPPKPKPKPNIFSIGKRPRRIQGGDS